MTDARPFTIHVWNPESEEYEEYTFTLFSPLVTIEGLAVSIEGIPTDVEGRLPDSDDTQPVQVAGLQEDQSDDPDDVSVLVWREGGYLLFPGLTTRPDKQSHLPTLLSLLDLPDEAREALKGENEEYQ